MDEKTAMAVTAVRAVETADRARTMWTDADRAWASRAAAEVVGESAGDEAFVARRALLALERLRQRKDRVARLASAWRWRPWVGVATVLAAFVIGAVFDAVGERRINILYSPVAPLALWNLVVYLFLAAHFVVRYGERGTPGPLVSALTWIAGGVRRTGSRDEAAVATFVEQWAAVASPVYTARATRILHFAAAALALGVIAGMYMRGIALEYRATWESTFLTPDAVHTLVSIFYAPGSLATHVPVPDAVHVAAIRAPASENAATWLHLMAATLAVVVLAPRLVLAVGSALVERYRAGHLVPAFDDAYFQRLLRGYRSGTLRVTVVPYSFTVDPSVVTTLQSLLARAFGGEVAATLAPSVTYGDEDRMVMDRTGGALLVALFNAAATPEREAHGRFLAALAQGGREVVMAVDEAAVNERFGPEQAKSRREAWREVAAEHGLTPVFVDLDHPDVDAFESALSS
jgi:hypothetical protein